MAENYPKEEDDAEPAGIDVSRLVRQLWAGRLTVSATTALALLVSIVYLHTLDFAYSASLTLVPTQNQQQGGLGNQVGSLASLAGINVGSAQGSSPFIVYPDTLTSRAVADEIIRRAPAVMRRIYRYAWNDRAGRWEEPESLRGKISKIVKPLLGLPVTHWTPPDGADLQAYIAQSVQSAQDPKKPVITLSYFNPDPQFAGYFLQLVHSSTDVVLRRMTLARANDYARYLYQRLPKTEGSPPVQDTPEPLLATQPPLKGRNSQEEQWINRDRQDRTGHQQTVTFFRQQFFTNGFVSEQKGKFTHLRQGNRHGDRSSHRVPQQPHNHKGRQRIGDQHHAE